jgi:hypothetical protein
VGTLQLGVNLQCAQHVVLAYHWWNPVVDYQSRSRVQRRGQESQLSFAVKFVLKNTIEEYMWSTCKSKVEKAKNIELKIDSRANIYSAFYPKTCIEIDSCFLVHHLHDCLWLSTTKSTSKLHHSQSISKKRKVIPHEQQVCKKPRTHKDPNMTYTPNIHLASKLIHERKHNQVSTSKKKQMIYLNEKTEDYFYL